MADFNYRTWWDGLPKEKQVAFALRIPSTWVYLEKQIKYGHRVPSRNFIKAMAIASEGEFSYRDLAEYFLMVIPD